VGHGEKWLKGPYECVRQDLDVENTWHEDGWLWLTVTGLAFYLTEREV
jgi:hypothetical protein